MLCVLAPTFTVAEEAEYSIRKLEWVGQPSATNHRVDVINPYGDIRVRPSESADIAVSGLVQELVPDQPRAELWVVQETETTTVRLRLPAGVEQFPGRVDLVVLLPTHVDVSARTIAGKIWTKSIRGSVIARTRTGDITATFKKLTRDRGNSALILETDSGDIEATFLRDADLGLYVTTAGVIQTQIPNDLIDTVRQGTGMLTGNLGSGTHPVTIRSASGTIRLRIPNAKSGASKKSGGGQKQQTPNA